MRWTGWLRSTDLDNDVPELVSWLHVRRNTGANATADAAADAAAHTAAHTVAGTDSVRVSELHGRVRLVSGRQQRPGQLCVRIGAAAYVPARLRVCTANVARRVLA
jgi:hypothetical protein